MSLQVTLDFLNALSQNNHKAWFDDHRREYEAARAAFENLVTDVVNRFPAVDDTPLPDPGAMIFRLNRDVRFSADKTPYKTHMSALFGPEGRNSMGRAYYLQVAPQGESMSGSGVFGLTDVELTKVRETIAEDARPLRAILAAPTFQSTFGKLMGEQVKTAPRGFAKDHPEIDLLRYKEFMMQHPFADAAVTEPDFPDQVITVFQAAKPLTMYFDALLGVRVKPEMHRGKKSQ
jgi:uncharacterized protein (TIGR02453 family)